MKQKKMIKRVLLLVLAVLMLCVSFAACGSEPTVNSTWTTADTDAVTYFTRILPQDAAAREKFIAASRGYNMSDPNFDDSKVELGVVKDVDVEAARLAPSALNQQKYHFTLSGDRAIATAGKGAYTDLDLGIAKYHFELGAGVDEKIWK